jgi:predicted DNA-binding transcriptional regulator YafY
MMDKSLKQNQIASAILAQDQLCFTYNRKKDDGTDEIVVRFVTPISLDENDVVHAAQHLPEEGFRNFKLDKIQSMQRVISRAFFPNIYQKDQGTEA